MRTLALFLLAVAVAAPAAAQNPFEDGLSLTLAAPAGELSPDNATTLDVQVTLDCALLATTPAGGSITLTATLDGSNATVATENIAVSPQTCTPPSGTTVTLPGTITVTPAASTPGLQPFALNVTATFPTGTSAATGSPSAAATQEVRFAYKPCYTLSHADGAVFDVSTSPYNFTLTQEYCANAYSMLMFEEVRVEGGGSLSGLELLMSEPGTRIDQALSFTPPDGDWTQSNVTFLVYIHSCDQVTGACGDPMLEARPRWTFRNAGFEGDGGDGGGGDNDSPAAAPLVALLALAGVAALRRRKA